MNSNNIAQLVKTHFTNCPLTGEISFGSHDIGWIELGSIWAVFDSRLPLRYQKLPRREKSEATERVFWELTACFYDENYPKFWMGSSSEVDLGFWQIFGTAP